MLIAGRIWWVRRSTATRHIEVAGKGLGPAIAIAVESGVIYSVCLAFLLALYLAGNFSQYILLDGVRYC